MARPYPIPTPGAGMRPAAPGARRTSPYKRALRAPLPARSSVVGVTKKGGKKKKTGFQQVLSSLRTNQGTQSRMSRFG